jgi:hypothetical protein
VSIAPIKDNEKIASFVAVKEDITHRKEMDPGAARRLRR